MTKENDDLEKLDAFSLPGSGASESVVQPGIDVGGPGGGPGGGTNSSGTRMTELPPGMQVVIVDSSGLVIGTGQVTEDGTIEQQPAETTVIHETSSPATDVSPGATAGLPLGGIAADAQESDGILAPAVGGAISPSAFDFKRDPQDQSKLKTSCVTIQFGYGLPGGQLPPTIVRVGTIITVPNIDSSGNRITVERAQKSAALAASLAANLVTDQLDEGFISSPEQVRESFVFFTQRNLQRQLARTATAAQCPPA